MLEWMTAKEALKTHKFGDLYLVYQPGYPLMISVLWPDGHGWGDVRSGLASKPTRFARINLPEDELRE